MTDDTTMSELDEAFASFGHEVDANDVPELVLSGVEVWSYGYGDDPEEFTTIDTNDLWRWGPADNVGNFNAETVAEIAADWGPFRVAK